MSPFDRARTTFYSTLIETMRLSCTVFELKLVICRKSPISTLLRLPHLHLALLLGWSRSNFAETFGIRKPESMDYREALFAWCCV